MTIIKRAKLDFRVDSRTKPEIYVPTKIPTTERAVKRIRKSHSIFKKDKSVVNPISEFKVIITKDVATACFMVNLENKTNAGTIIKPPPAPSSPVKIPTPRPITINKPSFFSVFPFTVTSVLGFIIRTEDKIIITLKNSINPISLVTSKDLKDNRVSGIFGIKNRRVKDTDSSAGSVNIRAVLYSINFFFTLIKVPIAADIPTTNKE